jgi:hypothetical protein
MLPSGEALVAAGFFGWWCSVAVPLVAHAENLSWHRAAHWYSKLAGNKEKVTKGDIDTTNAPISLFYFAALVAFCCYLLQFITTVSVQ